MDKVLILFTMEGCPFCDIMKEQLNELEEEKQKIANSFFS